MILGFVGKAGAGKNTAADIACAQCKIIDQPVSQLSFAEPLKHFVQKMFLFSHEQMFGASESRNTPDQRYLLPKGGRFSGSACPFLTPRLALQTLGTDWGRELYPNIWVDYAIREAHEREAILCHSLVCITDVRFANEVQAIHEAGGYTIHITGNTTLEGLESNHRSEFGVDPALCDVSITNNYNIQDFSKEVARAINTINLRKAIS